MGYLEDIKHEKELLHKRYILSSPSMKRDLSYDLTELDTLVSLLNGETINMSDSECEYVPFIYKFEFGLRESLLDEIDDKFEFYQYQAHNALERYKENMYDIKYHRRDIDSKELSQKELLDIAYDYLNSYDPKAYRLFKEMYEQGRILSHNGLDLALGLDGKCFSINALRRSYIMSREYPKNLIDLSVVIHEFGHSYENSLLFDKNLNQRQGIYGTFFNETSSFFFENGFYEYLFSNRINIKESILAKDLYFYLMFEQFLQSYLVLYSKEFSCEDIYVELSNREFKRIFNKFRRKFGFNIDMNNLPINISSTLSYANSMALSLKLYSLYKDNPNEFKKVFDTMLMSYGQIKDNEAYKTFGIGIDEMCELPYLDYELKLHNKRKNSL